MSKSIVYVLVVIVAAVAAGGVYHYFNAGQPADQAPVASEPATPSRADVEPPRPDHGNFQKRFQPSMPGTNGASK